MSRLQDEVAASDAPQVGETAGAHAPEVTVVIPTRNRRAFVGIAVADALAQEDVDLEVVVVDDGSTEPDAVAGLDELDPRLRVVRSPTHRGVAAARNTGIAHARGKWIAFLDDDDRWAPTKLRTQLDAAAKADAAWAYGGADTVDDLDRIVSHQGPGDPAMIKAGGASTNPVPGGCSNVIARADLVRAVGAFDERLSILADWDLWIRLADREQPALCPQTVVAYRRHHGSMQVQSIHELDDELDHVARKHGLTLRQADLLQWQANAFRRRGRRTRAARLYLRSFAQTRRPRDLVRAVGSLFGERAFNLVRRTVMHGGPLARPAWLEGPPTRRTSGAER
jgi:glycosyltransferase involved in cell wall biosynthesis